MRFISIIPSLVALVAATTPASGVNNTVEHQGENFFAGFCHAEWPRNTCFYKLMADTKWSECACTHGHECPHNDAPCNWADHTGICACDAHSQPPHPHHGF
ncbi:hypothetical protein F4777DRAFT_576489 [Nemania sp. FL0916]|nr:hypothetical protein F4777DRAFT_576489 [Nemania sp. FL0916]